MVNDGQFCIIKETNELVRFIGNMNGDYRYDLGVIEDSFGYFRIMRLSDIQAITDEEARELDPIMYDIFCDNDHGIYE